MKRTLSICCAGHFLVDFACAFLLIRTLRSNAAWAELLILYNFCAFAVQMPLGLLADRWNRDYLVAAFGTLLVAAAYALTGVPWLAAAVAGLGNAAFHVGAGLEVLSVSENRAGPLGLFVSPGAMGLFFGTLLGKGTALSLWLLPVVLFCAALALLWAKQDRPVSVSGCELPPIKTVYTPILLLFAVVVLRSYVGMSLSFPWKGEGNWALILTVAVALGKAAGGYLADRLGVIKTAAGSLICSALLLVGADLPVCGTGAILLFNMTMPLTLWACAQLLPGTRGFAFGILTFGLFLGFLPAAFSVGSLSGSSAALLALFSLLLLLPGLRKAVDR